MNRAIHAFDATRVSIAQRAAELTGADPKAARNAALEAAAEHLDRTAEMEEKNMDYLDGQAWHQQKRSIERLRARACDLRALIEAA